MVMDLLETIKVEVVLVSELDLVCLLVHLLDTIAGEAIALGVKKVSSADQESPSCLLLDEGSPHLSFLDETIVHLDHVADISEEEFLVLPHQACLSMS